MVAPIDVAVLRAAKVVIGMEAYVVGAFMHYACYHYCCCAIAATAQRSCLVIVQTDKTNGVRGQR